METVTLRRLLVLVKGLPPESGTWRNGDPWSQAEHFWAALLEQNDFWGRQNAVLHGVKPNDLPKPVRVARPLDDDE